ncbi:MAG: Na/Pi cotransporter family protein [Clostridia bacterium]|nr:Na/Pi cotransporter family protein [Clostridia bacterium]
MSIFDVLTLIGGLCLFLFGMNLMGQALEKRAGDSLRDILSKLTTKKATGFLTGLAVTAVIQSSSATTVMVVGFVNSGLLALGQAINVIMGANVGTTVTAWILSLSGIDSGNLFVQLLKPSSFTPVLALVGIIFYMFGKNDKKKDTGTILLGFATLMFGMETMSGAVSGLKDVPAFQNLFLMFQNPILGVIAGAVLTGIIQSSSASVGILQALSSTGAVTHGAAIPIIMGQNIGTCVTAMISSVGANKNARRAALVHLMFNIIGTVSFLVLFIVAKALFSPLAEFLNNSTNELGIAISHTVFNVFCTLLLLPATKLLEKLVCKVIPDTTEKEDISLLDERLFATPAIALECAHETAVDMSEIAFGALSEALESITNYTKELSKSVFEKEKRTDKYEDMIGTYLVKLSSHPLSEKDSREAAMLLKVIGDFERISDHGKNIVESVEELNEKGVTFSAEAASELSVIVSALKEITELAHSAFKSGDANAISAIEPLEQVIDRLREKLRDRHITRLQQGNCTIEVGFVWSDLLTNLERVSDHCSNVAGSLIDFDIHNMNMHENLRAIKKSSEEYQKLYTFYTEKYSI